MNKFLKTASVILVLLSTNTFADSNQEKVLQQMAKSVKIESGAQIDKKIGSSGAQKLAVMVKLNNYKCDSVSSAISYIRSVGFSLVCNNYRYKYEIEDVGGNWQVTVKK